MTTAPPPPMPRGKAENKFWDYHLEHPDVFETFRHLANNWRASRGPDARLSIAMLFEQARWHHLVYLGEGDPKLSNDHKPFYARLLMERCPELERIFILRPLQVECSFGPRNDDLMNYNTGL